MSFPVLLNILRFCSGMLALMVTAAIFLGVVHYGVTVTKVAFPTFEVICDEQPEHQQNP